MAVVPAEGARCRLCGEWREQAQFNLRNAKTGNRFSHCRVCASAMARERTGKLQDRVVLPKQRDRDRSEKTCSACGETLPIAAFEVQVASTGKRRNHCRPCRQAAKKRWNEQHASAKKTSDAAYREAHREELAERQRQWREAHPEQYRAIHSRHKTTHKDAVNASTHRRRHQIASNEGHWTATEWRALKARYDHRCLMCDRQEPEIRLTVDHIVPVSLGGSNSIANIQPLCRSCNSKKHRGIIDLRERADATLAKT